MAQPKAIRRTQPKAIGRREEALFLPLAALVTLMVVSTAVLVAHKNALNLLLLERRLEATQEARRIGRELDGETLPSPETLRQMRRGAAAVGILLGAETLVSTEGFVPAPPPAEIGWRGWPYSADRRVVSGSSQVALRRRFAGAFPGELTVQVDLPALGIATSARGLRRLGPMVLGIDVVLSLLVLLYVRRLVAPFDRALRRARESGHWSGTGDELGFLLSTFEDAVEALSTPPDDLGALERTLARSLGNGVLLLDDRGSVLTLNEIGATLLGVERPAPGTPVAELLAPHASLNAEVTAALAERRGVERSDYTLAGETPRTLGLTLHALRRGDGAIRGYLALFVDLTVAQRRSEERRLAERLAEIGEVSAGLAHEMRNSLASLRGYLTLLERDTGAPAAAAPESVERDTFLAELRHEADHLKRVVDDFLSFARPGDVHLEEVDLVRLFERAAADPALAGINVRLSHRHEADHRVAGDSHLLERAFRNLLRNAAEADRSERDGGEIAVSLVASDEYVEVTVSDRGPGVPEEIRTRVFHPFVSGRPDGVGLGLALTHRIVELHRGSVRLDAREGGGTEARVRLPRGTIVTDRNETVKDQGP